MDEQIEVMTYGPVAGIKIGDGFFYQGRHYILLAINKELGAFHVDVQPSGLPANQRITWIVPERKKP